MLSNDYKRERLTGKVNYLGWSKILLSELTEKGFFNAANSSTKSFFEPAFASKTCALIMNNVSLAIAGSLGLGLGFSRTSRINLVFCTSNVV